MSSLKASGRLSRLHQKIREELDLKSLGFESEVVVGRYRVDEINEKAKLIVEINGDYVHANPDIYKEDDQIRLPGSSYSAKDKWERDQKKIEKLKSLGYDVIVIWETDELSEKLAEISKALREDD
jgi:very-short-patch-repair endonuclease